MISENNKKVDETINDIFGELDSEVIHRFSEMFTDEPENNDLPDFRLAADFLKGMDENVGGNNDLPF